mmetsp:Transcript_14757/g.43318  ORF Transcript_14757/g.43318 Transcript_14757/m.43318 type:complete len:210 (-) Transcript_14757:475-1104(-)
MASIQPQAMISWRCTTTRGTTLTAHSLRAFPALNASSRACVPPVRSARLCFVRICRTAACRACSAGASSSLSSRHALVSPTRARRLCVSPMSSWWRISPSPSTSPSSTSPEYEIPTTSCKWPRSPQADACRSTARAWASHTGVTPSGTLKMSRVFDNRSASRAFRATLGCRRETPQAHCSSTGRAQRQTCWMSVPSATGRIDSRCPERR